MIVEIQVCLNGDALGRLSNPTSWGRHLSKLESPLTIGVNFFYIETCGGKSLENFLSKTFLLEKV